MGPIGGEGGLDGSELFGPPLQKFNGPLPTKF